MAGLKPNLPSQEVDKSKEMPELPDYIRQAIFGETPNKQAAYDKSLHRWWTDYSDRKNDEGDEHVADSLLYDRNHLPRSAPPPECVFEARRAEAQQAKSLQPEAKQAGQG